MATVLITGVTGFTGRHLARELEASGYTVFGIGRTESENVFSCDLFDKHGLIDILARVNPDMVVHLAGVAFVADDDIDTMYRTNVIGSRNLLAAIDESGINPSSIILASSANVYGNSNVQSITEDTPSAPINDYAVSKQCMENMAKLWFDKLPITIVRPFNYTGVGQSLNFLLPKIVENFKKKSPILELGNLDVIRDFSDVRSVARCYRLLLESDTHGSFFNICSGKGHSLKEVLDLTSEITDHRPEIRVNPDFVRANEVHQLIGSRAKLDSVIGSSPNIPLRETLKWMLESPT